MLGQSPLLDEMMEKLQSKINRELKFHQDLMKLRGALDMTLAQVCLSIFLPLFLLFHFPLILLCSFVCPPPVENERIELMIGCFESG
jgi:hypothetical protein